MSSITIWVSNIILVGLQFTHEILFHHFKTLSLCCQSIASEFTNFEGLTISLYDCVLCKILAPRVSLEKFSSLSHFCSSFWREACCKYLQQASTINKGNLWRQLVLRVLLVPSFTWGDLVHLISIFLCMLWD